MDPKNGQCGKPELAERKANHEQGKREHPPEFKARVAFAAMKARKPSSREPPVSVISHRDQQLERAPLDVAPHIFDQGPKSRQTTEAQVDELIVRSAKYRWIVIF